MPHHFPRNTFSYGVQYLFRGIHLATKLGLHRFMFWPIVLNTLLLLLIGSAVVTWIWSWLPNIGTLTAESSWIPFWDILLLALQWLVFGALIIVVGLGALWVYSSLAMSIAAPWMSQVAWHAEAYLRGTVPVRRDTPVGLQILRELGKFLVLAKWAIPLLLLSFIPGLNLLAPLWWFAFAAWLFAVEYLDFPAGNHGLGLPQVRRGFHQVRKAGLGLGSAIAVVMAVPLLNLVLMPSLVAASTLLWVEQVAEHAE